MTRWWRGRAMVLLAALLACLGTARLGWWQLDRAAQKVAWQQQLDARAHLPEIDANATAIDATTTATLLQRRASARGHWVPGATVFLDNRPLDGRAGFFVLTPLQRADGSALLVLRGWAPRDARDRARLPAVPTPAGEVALHGRLVAWPSALYDFGGPSGGVLRQNLERAAFAQETRLDLAPLVLQLLPSQGHDEPADGLSRHWPAPAADVQKHYGYAAQWLAMSALVFGLTLWFQLLRPRRQRPHAARPDTPP